MRLIRKYSSDSLNQVKQVKNAIKEKKRKPRDLEQSVIKEEIEKPIVGEKRKVRKARQKGMNHYFLYYYPIFL